MTECRKCGLEISFERKAGKYGELKWFPINLDGSEHWNVCKKLQRGMIDVAQLMAQNPPIRTRGQFSHVWNGSLAPWDESLGDFRDFTPEEKNSKAMTEVSSLANG